MMVSVRTHWLDERRSTANAAQRGRDGRAFKLVVVTGAGSGVYLLGPSLSEASTSPTGPNKGLAGAADAEVWGRTLGSPRQADRTELTIDLCEVAARASAVAVSVMSPLPNGTNRPADRPTTKPAVANLYQPRFFGEPAALSR